MLRLDAIDAGTVTALRFAAYGAPIQLWVDGPEDVGRFFDTLIGR